MTVRLKHTVQSQNGHIVCTLAEEINLSSGNALTVTV